MAKSQPLSPDLPHVAYMLLWFPLFTQPFIFREVKCLKEFLPVEVYTLYGKNSRFWSSEMRESEIQVNRLGIRAFFSLFWSTIKAFYRCHAKLWIIFRQCCLRHWRNPEIFGENLWAFCAGCYLAGRLREDGIDLLYAPWPRGAATAARVAGSLCGLPYIIAARGDNLNPADPDLDAKFADALLVRTNNAADRQRIENFGAGQAKGKTCLVYNSLTLPSGNCRRDGEKRSGKPLQLLAVGRFDVTKGFDILLKACALLKNRGLNFRLTLVGGGGKVMGLGNLEKYLRNLRKELDLEQVVAMPGLISHDNLPQLLEKHDVFVAPCVVHESGRRDGIPNTVIEAMAYGLPVIGSNINALPEVILHEKTGLLTPPDNPEALAEAITMLAKDPLLAAQMGRNGAEHALNLFDCHENARKLAKAFIAAWNLQEDKNPGETCQSCAE